MIIVNPRALTNPFTVFFLDKDPIALYDAGLTQVLRELKPVAVKVEPTKKVAVHPQDDGTEDTDDAIINPLKIEIQYMLSIFEHRQVYQELEEYFSTNELFTIQTLAGTYENMLLEAMPHKESTQTYDNIALSLVFLKRDIANTNIQKIDPIKSKDSNTVDNGRVQAQDATNAQEEKARSTLHKVFF